MGYFLTVGGWLKVVQGNSDYDIVGATTKISIFRFHFDYRIVHQYRKYISDLN